MNPCQCGAQSIAQLVDHICDECEDTYCYCLDCSQDVVMKDEDREKGYQCPFTENGWHDPFYGLEGWICRDCHAKLRLGVWYHQLEEPESEPEW